jgi:hypothetical protein
MTIQWRNDFSGGELLAAPELASLALVDTALSMAILMLLATYPEIEGLEPEDQTTTLRAATVVLEDARTLAASMARYRVVLRRTDRSDDLPF